MRLDHLDSLVAIADHGSFSAAASAINLSHSAVSIQIRQLEETAGIQLFDRSTRPPTLTQLGHGYVSHAREILAKVDGLRSLGRKDSMTGKIAFGFVPTTLQTLLPKVLHHLQRQFPDLDVTARSGLSDELARDVAQGALDFAFLTSPSSDHQNVKINQIKQEQLFVIAPRDATQNTARTLLESHPYITFSRNTGLGQDIMRAVQAKGIKIKTTIELDSIDAVEQLVAQGFGVSIVPQRLIARPLSETLHCIPFDGTRDLALASHKHSMRVKIKRSILAHLLA